MLVSLSTASWSLAQTVDWQAVEKIAPSTGILVKTQEWTHCYLERVTADKLTCISNHDGFTWPDKRGSEFAFQRDEISDMRIERYDWSGGFPSLLLGAGAGGGLDSSRQPTAFGGVKIGGIGGPISLDLQYDRIRGNSGFSTEGSAVLPLFRVPRFQKFVVPGSRQAKEDDEKKRFLRVYAEPGIGYRAGGSPFGGYCSAKVLFLLFPEDKAQPYVEFQRRFPFNSPLQGDDRLTFGVMLTICEHCGWD